MKPEECGFANPPAEGTPAREAVDRMRDFLRWYGSPPKKGDPPLVMTPETMAWMRGEDVAPTPPVEEKQ